MPTVTLSLPNGGKCSATESPLATFAWTPQGFWEGVVAEMADGGSYFSVDPATGRPSLYPASANGEARDKIIHQLMPSFFLEHALTKFCTSRCWSLGSPPCSASPGHCSRFSRVAAARARRARALRPLSACPRRKHRTPRRYHPDSFRRRQVAQSHRVRSPFDGHLQSVGGLRLRRPHALNAAFAKPLVPGR